jgi:hypothetical protein
MPVKGILKEDSTGKIVMTLKEIENMTDEEYRAVVEEEFKKLEESEKEL